MLILNPDVFASAIEAHPQKASAIRRIRTVLEMAEPNSSADLRALLPSMEKFPGHPHAYRFDVGGRKGLRMIAIVVIQHGEVDVLMLGTHAEYDSFKI